MTPNELQERSNKRCNCSGATIIEALVAITLLFIALTAALYAQSRLAESLGTKDLTRVEVLADSLMVTLVADTSYVDTTLQLPLDNGKYVASITINLRDSVRAIRVSMSRRSHSKSLHTLYYEGQLGEQDYSQ